MRKVVCDQKLRPNIPNWWQSYEVRSAFTFASHSPSIRWVKSKYCKLSSNFGRFGGCISVQPGSSRLADRLGVGGEESTDICHCFLPRHYGWWVRWCESAGTPTERLDSPPSALRKPSHSSVSRKMWKSRLWAPAGGNCTQAAMLE